MRYLSLFSGIEAATAAWHPLGWECVAVAEIEPFPCAVLAHHYPNVPNLGSVTEITEDRIKELGHIDVVVFGSPCQDLSVAGHRKGLIHADGTVTRSGLFFTAINISRWSGARFWLWENVLGAFSSNKGRDFASVVEFMAGLDDVPVPVKGWCTEGVAVGDNGLLEWCVLDAQWFGVAQRRRRVFALLDTGDWANRPPILLEPESMRGDFAPSREAGQGITRGAAASSDSRGWPAEVSSTLDTTFGTKQGLEDQHVNDGCPLFVPVAHSLRGEGFDASEDGTGSGTPLVPVAGSHWDNPQNPPPTLNQSGKGSGGIAASNQEIFSQRGGGLVPVGFTQNQRDEVRELEVAGCLSSEPGMKQQTYIAFTAKDHGGDGGRHDWVMTPTMQVRRLTPVECERLQGFPDNYTLIPWRNKPADQCPDGPRYKALGNSMAVPVMAWIGRRIQMAVQWGSQ